MKKLMMIGMMGLMMSAAQAQESPKLSKLEIRIGEEAHQYNTVSWVSKFNTSTPEGKKYLLERYAATPLFQEIIQDLSRLSADQEIQDIAKSIKCANGKLVLFRTMESRYTEITTISIEDNSESLYVTGILAKSSIDVVRNRLRSFVQNFNKELKCRSHDTSLDLFGEDLSAEAEFDRG